MEHTQVTKKCFFFVLMTIALISFAYFLNYGKNMGFRILSGRYRNDLYNASSVSRTLTTEVFDSSVPVSSSETTIPPKPALGNTKVSELKVCQPPAAFLYNITKDVTPKDVLNKTAIEAVQLGGKFEPRNCRPRDVVAIIVPYRNRTKHLEILVNHLHNFLQQQMIRYDIFLVEPAHEVPGLYCEQMVLTKINMVSSPYVQGLSNFQQYTCRHAELDEHKLMAWALKIILHDKVLPIIFNRGILCNVGFKEAMARLNYSCIIIHDVDMLPLNTENSYTCGAGATHMGTEQSVYKYKNPYPSYIGGAVSIASDFYRQINGLSNVFFGWGGEDDDLRMRIQLVSKKQQVSRPAKGIGRYISLAHGRDNLNPVNPIKFTLYKTSKQRYKEEGLNTLRYKVIAKEFHLLYTLIKVYYNETAIMKEFNAKWNKPSKEVIQIEQL